MQGWLRLWVGWLLVCCGVFLATAVCRASDQQSSNDQTHLYTDFATNLRVQMIGHRLARAAECPNITFFVTDDREMNAYSTPNGEVYVSSLLATAVTDDELAFVLGHEITHIRERHAKDQMQRSTVGSLIGAMLVTLIWGAGADIRLGADLVGGLTEGHFSRKDERRADVGGVCLMSQCGYDPYKAAGAMQRVIDKYGRGDAHLPVLGWFASHPDGQERKQRIIDKANELAKHPLSKIDDPEGIAVTLDPSAEHARLWLPDYLAIRVTMFSFGKYVVLQQPAPVVMPATPSTPPAQSASNRAAATAAPVTPSQATPAPDKPTKKKNKSHQKVEDPPLDLVTVVTPSVPAGYQVTVSLHRVAPGLDLDGKPTGTAVEATLAWTQVATGFTGVCTAVAQTEKTIPWMAQDQLHDATQLRKLSNGDTLNLEGALEATAIRRAAMAFAEILEADGPIDHTPPVTITMAAKNLRSKDYIEVVRGDQVVSEVEITQIERKTITGSVLWGTHTWQSDDKFQPADGME